MTDFQTFWTEFPKQRRVNKPGALKAWNKAIKTTEPEVIMAGLRAYAKCDDVLNGFACMPTTWLNQERWEATYEAVEKKPDKSILKARYWELKKRYEKGAYHDWMTESEVSEMREIERSLKCS